MLADIPNGVTVCSSELVAGGILQEGTVLGGKDDAGLYHVVKTARLTEAATATTKSLQGGERTSFQSRRFYHVESRRKGLQDYIYQHVRNALRHHQRRHYFRRNRPSRRSPCTAAAESADATSAFKYVPKAMTGDSYDVEALNNHFVTAVTIGQFKESVIPAVSDDIKAALPGISLI